MESNEVTISIGDAAKELGVSVKTVSIYLESNQKHWRSSNVT